MSIDHSMNYTRTRADSTAFGIRARAAWHELCLNSVTNSPTMPPLEPIGLTVPILVSTNPIKTKD